MALDKGISKSTFFNILRCDRFFALHKLEHCGADANVTFDFTKTVEDLYTEEYEQKVASLIESINSSLGDDDTEEEKELTVDSDIPEIFQLMYRDVEKYATLKVKELFPNSIVKSGNNLQDQFKAWCLLDQTKFYAFVDIYQETDDEIKIYEVKASTSSAYFKTKDLFNQRDDGIYVFNPECKTTSKAIYNRLESTGMGRKSYDLALQRYVLEHSENFNPQGKKVKYYLALLNKDYVHETDSKVYQYPENYPTSIISIFDLTNVTKKICTEQIELDVQTVLKRINDLNASSCKLSNECQKGGIRECKYFSQCLDDKNITLENSLYYYIKCKQNIVDGKTPIFYDLLEDSKMKYAKNISDEYLKNTSVKIQKECLIENKRYIDLDGIKAWISILKYPIYHLDFETLPSPFPRFNQEKCYTQSPFQFSIHIEREPGVCDEEKDNVSFLAKNHEVDERLELLKKLVETIKDDGGSIVAFNKSFEKSVLTKLGEHFPQYQNKIANWLTRLVDLKDCVSPSENVKQILSGKGNYKYDKKDTSKPGYFFYDKKLCNSFSIKKVLPVFSTRNYKQLAVQNGCMAYSTFLKLADLGKTDYERRYNDMLSYCKLDTYSMFLILQELRKLAKEHL